MNLRACLACLAHWWTFASPKRVLPSLRLSRSVLRFCERNNKGFDGRSESFSEVSAKHDMHDLLDRILHSMAVVYFEGAAGVPLEFFSGPRHPFAGKPHNTSPPTPPPPPPPSPFPPKQSPPPPNSTPPP